MGIEKSADAFKTISEVADDLQVPQHVLRFWEGRFPQIKPIKRAGGRRYYRPEDVDLLGKIRDLLYKQGFTIKSVQMALKEGGMEIPPKMDENTIAAAPPVIESQPSLLIDDSPEQQLAFLESPAPPVPPPSPPPVLAAPPVAVAAAPVPLPTQSLPPPVRQELLEILDELEQLRYLLLAQDRA